MKKAIAFLAVAVIAVGCGGGIGVRTSGSHQTTSKAGNDVHNHYYGNQATQDAKKEIDALKAAAAVAGKDNSGNADLKGKE